MCIEKLIPACGRVQRVEGVSSIGTLTANGSGVMDSDSEGRTYLHYAAQHGMERGVTWLLKHGADYDAADNQGTTALARCASGDSLCLELLIRAGADVDRKDMEGVSPLHRAALSGQLANLKLLLASRADVNTFDLRNGPDAPRCAATCGDADEGAYAGAQAARPSTTHATAAMSTASRCSSSSVWLYVGLCVCCGCGCGCFCGCLCMCVSVGLCLGSRV